MEVHCNPWLRDTASFLELTGSLGRVDWGLIRSEGLIATILCTLYRGNNIKTKIDRATEYKRCTQHCVIDLDRV